MGELITANLKNTDGSETVMQQWTQDLASTRSTMFSGIKTGDKLMMAFAKARAMQQILSTTKNERLKAELLIVTDPDVAMVELANNPTPDDRVRICAIACMTGFVPGSGEFGIFGGGNDKNGKAKPGKLFVKEAGYRTLFAQLGVVAHVEVDHPEYVPFGTSGKKVWRVAGRAHVEVNGEHHEAVYQIGSNGIDFRLGISGYESDIIASVTAKARRQMLKQLWTMVSPMLSEDHADDDDVLPQNTDQPAAITQQIEKQPEPTQEEQHKGSLDRIRKILGDNPDQLTFVESVWNEIAAAKTQEKLEEAGKELAAMKASVSQQVLSLVRPFYQARQSELKGGAA
jgi:hypothetical protein